MQGNHPLALKRNSNSPAVRPAQAHAQRDINCLSDPDRAKRRNAVRSSGSLIYIARSRSTSTYTSRPKLTAGCCLQLRRLQTKLLEGGDGTPAASPGVLQVVAALLQLNLLMAEEAFP